MSELLSLASLRKKQPDFIDVPLGELGTMRVARLGVTEKLEVMEMVESIERDEEGNPLNDDASVSAFVEIACMCLVGPTGKREFDCDEGRELISKMDDDHFADLMNTVLLQIGMGSRKVRQHDTINEDDNLDAAKNV